MIKNLFIFISLILFSSNTSYADCYYSDIEKQSQIVNDEYNANRIKFGESLSVFEEKIKLTGSIYQKEDASLTKMFRSVDLQPVLIDIIGPVYVQLEAWHFFNRAITKSITITKSKYKNLVCNTFYFYKDTKTQRFKLFGFYKPLDNLKQKQTKTVYNNINSQLSKKLKSKSKKYSGRSFSILHNTLYSFLSSIWKTRKTIDIFILNYDAYSIYDIQYYKFSRKELSNYKKADMEYQRKREVKEAKEIKKQILDFWETWALKDHLLLEKTFTYMMTVLKQKKVFLKFFQPEEVKLSKHNKNVREIEICISKETWKELIEKI